MAAQGRGGSGELTVEAEGDEPRADNCGGESTGFDVDITAELDCLLSLSGSL